MLRTCFNIKPCKCYFIIEYAFFTGCWHIPGHASVGTPSPHAAARLSC